MAWYLAQDFSQMNDDVRAKRESIFSPGDGYDVNASLQVGVNNAIIGQY